MPHREANAAVIEQEMDWFHRVLDRRLDLHSSQQPSAGKLLSELPPPALPAYSTPYADALHAWGLEPAERLVLALAFAPHIRPELLDPFLLQNQALGRRFTEFGGLVGQSHGGVLPTCETAMFLLAGDVVAERLRYRGLFGADHPFHKQTILETDHRHQEEPPLSSALRLTAATVHRLTSGETYDPPFSAEFPAQRIDTPLEWADLVLEPSVRRDVDDIVDWLRHENTLMEEWGLSRRLKRGYRAMFYGPPGTGKTLTACLLGKATGRPVYRVDLSKVVSKWIGETEKNLASLFDHAEHQNWVLFFDEADSLFGRRTEQRSANDRAGNQQVSYLLQRIEDYPGLVILATNLKTHLDEAFSRRFQSMILFRIPGPDQRRQLWQDAFAGKPFRLAPDIDLAKLAQDHELAGGAIINVLRHACLRAVTRQPQQVERLDVEDGVRRELHKDGRFLA